MRNSHLLLCKTGIFSSATAIVVQTSINCSYAKTSKQQLTAHLSIVKEIVTKCSKHMLSFCKHTFIGVINLINSIAQNTNQINSLQNIITTKLITQWLILLAQKVAFQSISSTYHLCQTQESILQ